MDIVGIVVWGTFIWTLLIVGWWCFWAWYGRGELHPTSWRAVLTMPVWSLRSVLHGRRLSQARARVAAAKGDVLAELRAELHLIRLARPPTPQGRRQVVVKLEQALRDAPPGLPADIYTDIEQTIELLREDSP